MSEFAVLERAMGRSIALATAVCLALLATTITSLTYAFYANGNARDAGARMPVLVVPGAVGGIYSPGITEEHLLATARYLASLATNFGGGKNFQERFDELESFSSPTYLPNLQNARLKLQRDVETQNQARTFFAIPGTENLRQIRPGHFSYTVRGERVVYASGLPMDNHTSEANLHLLWGTPSARNRVGVFLEGFDINDIAPGDGSSDGDAASDGGLRASH